MNQQKMADAPEITNLKVQRAETDRLVEAIRGEMAKLQKVKTSIYRSCEEEVQAKAAVIDSYVSQEKALTIALGESLVGMQSSNQRSAAALNALGGQSTRASVAMSVASGSNLENRRDLLIFTDNFRPSFAGASQSTHAGGTIHSVAGNNSENRRQLDILTDNYRPTFAGASQSTHAGGTIHSVAGNNLENRRELDILTAGKSGGINAQLMAFSYVRSRTGEVTADAERQPIQSNVAAASCGCEALILTKDMIISSLGQQLQQMADQLSDQQRLNADLQKKLEAGAAVQAQAQQLVFSNDEATTAVIANVEQLRQMTESATQRMQEMQNALVLSVQNNEMLSERLQQNDKKILWLEKTIADLMATAQARGTELKRQRSTWEECQAEFVRVSVDHRERGIDRDREAREHQERIAALERQLAGRDELIQELQANIAKMDKDKKWAEFVNVVSTAAEDVNAATSKLTSSTLPTEPPQMESSNNNSPTSLASIPPQTRKRQAIDAWSTEPSGSSSSPEQSCQDDTHDSKKQKTT